MLTDNQKNEIAMDVRTTVSRAYQAEMGKQNNLIGKRFSPGVSVAEANKEYSLNRIGKIYTKDGTIVDEPAHQFKSLGDMATQIIKAGMPDGYQTNELRDWVQKTAGYMESGTGDMGGYLLPVSFANQILNNSLGAALIRPLATYMPMSSNRLEVPAVTDPDHSSSLFGGINISTAAEGGQYQASNPKFGKIGLTLHKITGLCHVTDELLEDSPMALEKFLDIAFSQSIAFTEDELFINGNGAGQPLGMLNSSNPAIITADPISGQGSGTLVAENIRDMWKRMYPQGKKRAIWLYNSEVFSQLFGMALTIGTGSVPIWLPAGGASETPYQTLMGRPAIETEHCQALGTAGDIALIDPGAYLIAGKGDGSPNFAQSIHFRFDTGEQSFRWTLRLDGQPWWLSTLTPKHGTSTLSPYIVLNSNRS